MFFSEHSVEPVAKQSTDGGLQPECFCSRGLQN